MQHSRINEHIWCGGALSPADWRRLYQEGVRLDLSLQAEARDDFGDLVPEGELWLPADDWYMPSIDQLVIAARFIHTAVSLGKGIVVHCKHGIGRAPMTVACYFVTQGMSSREAISFVRSRRAIVDPNPGQIAVVKDFERLTQVAAFDF